MAKNYWPHAIVISLVLIIISCVTTIVVASFSISINEART